MTSNQDIRNFYNEFTTSRMVSYRLYGNTRLTKAIKFIQEYIYPDSYVLDIGCGIGIISEAISKQLKQGYIWAYDISDNNIQYAKETIAAKNISFCSGNVINQFDEIKNTIHHPIDLVVMVDVIEHIPLSSHNALLENLSSVMSDTAYFVLTFPSPEYQVFLKENNPDEYKLLMK